MLTTGVDSGSPFYLDRFIATLCGLTLTDLSHSAPIPDLALDFQQATSVLSKQMDNNLTDMLKKALYLGVGLASYATEQIGDIQVTVQEAADDLIRRGESTSEEATRLISTWMPQDSAASSSHLDRPQDIEIISIEDVKSDLPPDA
jgi:polyhydroxyalkanoate synthesis regulator phasin